MKLEATAKEIADLVLALQGRQISSSDLYNCVIRETDKLHRAEQEAEQ